MSEPPEVDPDAVDNPIDNPIPGTHVNCEVAPNAPELLYWIHVFEPPGEPPPDAAQDKFPEVSELKKDVPVPGYATGSIYVNSVV